MPPCFGGAVPGFGEKQDPGRVGIPLRICQKLPNNCIYLIFFTMGAKFFYRWVDRAAVPAAGSLRCLWVEMPEVRAGLRRDFKLWFPFSFLAIPSVWDQSSLPASQTPVRMRRNSFTPRASADTVKRPRHYSVGSKPLDLLGPLPSLEARDGAERPQLQVGVQVVPSLRSPPSPMAPPEIQTLPQVLITISVHA